MTLKGPSGLPGKCLQLGLFCTGETPLGQESAGLRREESRKGLGKEQGGKGDRWLVAWPKHGGSNMSAWFGVERCSKVMGMREKAHLPAAPWLAEEQQLGTEGHKLLMRGRGTVPCGEDPTCGAAGETYMGSFWPFNDKEEMV